MTETSGRLRTVASIEEVRAQIRFLLAELGIRNQHHGFEDICREFARNRICRNILPATGPVSAGGDQGRDFETFRTYLATCGLAATPLLGTSASDTLVFACTVQRTSVNSKIRADVQKILKGPQRPARIYFFTTVNINVAERHRLQEWAQKTAKTDLDVIDQQALAEHLSDRDLFWVAREYLHVPSEIYPPLPEDPELRKYEEKKRDWVSREVNTESFSEFEDLKRLLRRASRTAELAGDVEFLCGRIRPFRLSTMRPLQRRAIYEEVVARIHAFGDLRGQEAAIRNFFALPAINERGDERDTSTLMGFVLGASKRGIVDIDIQEIGNWRDALARHLDTTLSTTDLSNCERCLFLDVRGTVALLASAQENPPVPSGAATAVRHWTEMVGLVENAPLYPLDSFVRYVSEVVPIVGPDPGYRNLVSQLDIVLSKRAGKRAAAECAYRRSRAWRETGRVREAIEELHSAKVDWYAAETLDLSVRSMIEISRWYASIGLCCAGKYYAMAAAYVASQSHDHDILRLLPTALLAVADYEYQAGAWANFLVWAKRSLPFLGRLGPTEEGKLNEELSRLAFHAFTSLLACDLLGLTSLSESVKSFIAAVGFEGTEGDIMPSARKAWPDRSALLKSARDQLNGPPFSDVGRVRRIEWKALGITWSVRFINDYSTTVAAEEFVALLQVLLAELSRVDLCFIPTRVDVAVRVEDVAHSEFRRVPTNHASEWDVILSSRTDLSSTDGSLLTNCFQILRDTSLATDKEFFEVLERSFSTGLSSKVFVAQSFRKILSLFLSEEDFAAFSRNQTHDLRPGDFVRDCEELAWLSVLRPDYKSDNSALLERRYNRPMHSLRFTLPRLQRSSQFRATVRELRSEGWLDWHILAAVASAAINERNPLGDQRSLVVYARKFQNAMDRDEEETDPELPLSLFETSKIRAQIMIVMLSSVKMLGLTSHQSTPDLEAIKTFMAKRHRYLDDDIPHEPLIFNDDGEAIPSAR